MISRGRVLVADDDDAMRTTVAFTLLDEGYDVEEAASGNQVLELVETAATDAPRTSEFDLIVMDIRMPGLSGLETVRRLRELRSPTPVILMTAFASPETIDDARRLRVAALLSKPFALAELRDLAQQTLRSGSGGNVHSATGRPR